MAIRYTTEAKKYILLKGRRKVMFEKEIGELLERYVPINRRDFFAYKRKTIAEWYNQMRLFGLWK